MLILLSWFAGVSNSAFQHLMEFTYTATLSVNGSEEVNDVWRAAEYLQMQEAIKALNNRSVPPSLVRTVWYSINQEESCIVA